jgi:hypothetical protein
MSRKFATLILVPMTLTAGIAFSMPAQADSNCSTSSHTHRLSWRPDEHDSLDRIYYVSSMSVVSHGHVNIPLTEVLHPAVYC